MQKIETWDDIELPAGPTVATVGNFDGVHLGHQAIIKRARQLADEQSMPLVQNLIILAGKVEPAWLKGRIKKAFKIVSEQLFEADDSFALENIWVFLVPASGGRVELPQFPPLIKINVLDNSHAETIDPQVISPLLQQAMAGGAA